MASTIDMGDDGVVRLTHHIDGDDTFDTAAQGVFDLLRRAQQDHPDRLRMLTVTIDGQQGERAGFNEDFFEFQQEFLLGTLGRFITWIELPLTGKLGNPNAQDNQLPDRLAVKDD